MTNFTKDFFASNRTRLRASFGGEAMMIFSANALLQKKGDTTFPFKQEPNFWYLTGCKDPELVLVMDAGKEFLILPKRSSTSELFGGSIDAETITNISGIKKVYEHDKGWAILQRKIKKAKFIATLSQKKLYDDDHDMFINPAPKQLITDITVINKDVQLIDLTTHLAKLRMIKQPAELEAITQACTASGLLFAAIAKDYKKFTSEKDLHRFVAVKRAEAMLDFAYDPIVANHAHANTLHYIDTSTDPLIGATLFDIGYEYDQYAADISRTYAVEDSRYDQVYDAVIDIYDFACSLLKPGLTRRDLEMKTRDYMGEKLRELGLIDVISYEAIGEFFPHALSHHVGLEVHDAQVVDEPLAENMVITIEPGIYIQAENLGVRFEDTVVITKDGYKNLCVAAPQKLGTNG